jgi:ATP/maltotriose-dependent transcriptional regulator MalT
MRYSNQAIEILRISGTPSQQAMAMQGLANELVGTDPDKALELGESARELARTADEARILCSTTIGLSSCHSDCGSYERAHALAGEALEIARGIGDESFEAAALICIAAVALARADYSGAWGQYLEAAERYRVQRAGFGLGQAVGGLAASSARLGDADLARRLRTSFEHWESERGHPLDPLTRRQFVSAFRELDAATLGPAEPPLTLEEAVELARVAGPAARSLDA